MLDTSAVILLLQSMFTDLSCCNSSRSSTNAISVTTLQPANADTKTDLFMVSQLY